MKQLTQDGGEVTVAQFKPQPSRYVKRIHDPFPSHGQPNGLFTEVITASGKHLFLYGWDLLSSGNQFYVWANEVTGDDMVSLYNQWQAFVTQGLPGWWEGEAYNYFVRPRTTLKFDDDQLNDYLNAN